MDHVVIRIMGKRRRVFGGWIRDDKIRLNGNILNFGFIRITRKNRVETVTTHCKGQEVSGYDVEWLARKHGRNIKLGQPLKKVA